MRAAGGIAAFCALAACAPLPVAEAERRCREEIAAPGPRLGGVARLGATFGPEGARIARRLDLELTLTRAPGAEAAWRACVLRRSGRPPERLPEPPHRG